MLNWILLIPLPLPLLLRVVPWLTISIRVARILHWDRDYILETRQSISCVDLPILSNRDDDATFPIAAIKLWGL